MGLEIEADHLVSGQPAEFHGGRRRQEAGIGGEQIASRGQHVAAAALRRAGRASRHALAVERGDEGVALGLGASLPQGIGNVRRRGAPIDMQPVLDGEVLEVAQPGVDLAQRLVGMKLSSEAGLAGEARALRRLDDEARQTLAPPPVEPIGDGIFVDQPLELLRRG